MKLIFFCFCFVCCAIFNTAYSQNPALDFSAIDNWPHINSLEINSSGDCVFYYITQHNSLNGKVESKLEIVSSTGEPKKQIKNVISACFSADGKKVIFLKEKNILGILNISTQIEEDVPDVASFQISSDVSSEWLTYLKTNHSLVLRNLSSERTSNYTNVIDYLLSKSGNKLLLKIAANDTTQTDFNLDIVDCRDQIPIAIWQGANAENFIFNNSETNFAFTGKQKSSESNKIYLQAGKDSAKILVNDSLTIDGQKMIVRDAPLHFNADGSKIFFLISKATSSKDPDPKKAKVDIWNYKDQFVQVEQQSTLSYDRNLSFTSAVNLLNKKVVRLEQDTDGIWKGGRGDLNTGGDDNYMVTESKANVNHGNFNRSIRPETYIINTNDGSRTVIGSDQAEFGRVKFSPSGKYVYWYDPEKKVYFTYDIHNAKTTSITGGIPVKLFDDLSGTKNPPRAYGAAAWLKNDSALLIYDRYDIWLVDPRGKNNPENLTNGYGRKNKIQFRCVITDEPAGIEKALNKTDTALILSAFDEQTKANGFFRISINKRGNPVKLIMDSALFYFPNYFSEAHNSTLRKAKNAGTYVLTKQNAGEFPNIVATRDFIHFVPLSNIEPQNKYNWMTTELLTYKTFNGAIGQGILYRPENFNPKEKYPLILYFYDHLSDGLHKFINPDYALGPMNIPWFVSHGYLVFCPDIFYKLGNPGPSAFNYVVSAAKMLSQKPYVDAKKMGIQGHSWGGYEVNYIITQTHLFAAAASAAGPSDFISDYGSIAFGADQESFIEYFQPRMGKTLWDGLNTYIKNSPVILADKVATPLLIMHNKADGNVPWGQGLEMFLALNRLNKKVWMLQYDDGNHIVTSRASQSDYTIRLSQFFNYYLKDSLPPVWMTKGVPARLKGIDSGLEYDTSGNKP